MRRIRGARRRVLGVATTVAMLALTLPATTPAKRVDLLFEAGATMYDRDYQPDFVDDRLFTAASGDWSLLFRGNAQGGSIVFEPPQGLLATGRVEFVKEPSAQQAPCTGSLSLQAGRGPFVEGPDLETGLFAIEQPATAGSPPFGALADPSNMGNICASIPSFGEHIAFPPNGNRFEYSPYPGDAGLSTEERALLHAEKAVLEINPRRPDTVASFTFTNEWGEPLLPDFGSGGVALWWGRVIVSSTPLDRRAADPCKLYGNSCAVYDPDDGDAFPREAFGPPKPPEGALDKLFDAIFREVVKETTDLQSRPLRARATKGAKIKLKLPKPPTDGTVTLSGSLKKVAAPALLGDRARVVAKLSGKGRRLLRRDRARLEATFEPAGEGKTAKASKTVRLR